MKDEEKPRVDVLLSTFNGGRFLREQLDSLLEQSFRDWNLIARDDGSSDDTKAVVAEYAAKYPGRITVVEDLDRGLGVALSFSRLMGRSSAPYIMFADQDDVWLADKIELTLKHMTELERSCGTETPLLVHTDMKVADENKRVLSPSFWRYQHIDPRTGRKWTRLLIQNSVTGCAAMINRSLKNLAFPIPKEAAMHDWWLALTAAAFGRIEAVPEATMLYRQHAASAVGAKEWNWNFIARRAAAVLSGRWQDEKPLLKSFRQSRAFLERHAARLGKSRAEMLGAYSEISAQGFWRRKIFLVRNDILKTGLIRNIGLMLEI